MNEMKQIIFEKAQTGINMSFLLFIFFYCSFDIIQFYESNLSLKPEGIKRS